ncbi:MAG: transposase [Pseudobdellovibrionaceae bacterium]
MSGDLSYQMKTPWRDGTTHVRFSPLDFIARLVALIPPPRINLIRYSGVFAPNFKDRKLIVKKASSNACEVADKIKQERLRWSGDVKASF